MPRIWVCRRGNTLLARTGCVETQLAREVMAINPGLRLSANDWKYVGYKGGSEPGVLDLTFLLESAKAPEKWFVVTATWNDPKHVVNESTFLDLVTQAIELTAKSWPSR